MRSFFLVAALGLLAGCYDDDCDDCDGDGPPELFESEPNDDPLTANHFGLLLPGDRFFINGFVRDDPVDPFDGFAFTAGQPLHVDFQLFTGSSLADLDVCLYDPQLDQTVDCFATNGNPEQGGVDVSPGGLDFHLVVESFTGDSDYSLEIVVLPLFIAATAEDSSALSVTGVRAVDARSDHATDAGRTYRKGEPRQHQVLRIEQQLEFDPETGTVLELVRLGGTD